MLKFHTDALTNSVSVFFSCTHNIFNVNYAIYFKLQSSALIGEQTSVTFLNSALWWKKRLALLSACKLG